VGTSEFDVKEETQVVNPPTGHPIYPKTILEFFVVVFNFTPLIVKLYYFPRGLFTVGSDDMVTIRVGIEQFGLQD
jgi:hypothetical protein